MGEPVFGDAVGEPVFRDSVGEPVVGAAVGASVSSVRSITMFFFVSPASSVLSSRSPLFLVNEVGSFAGFTAITLS